MVVQALMGYIVNVSHGVDVRDLPEQAAIERLLEEHHIKVLT